MKHFFTLLFLSVLIISCSNDDSNNNNNSNVESSHILGKWALYKETHNGNNIYPDYILDENDLIETLAFVDDYGADENGFYTGIWWDYHNYSDVFDWKSVGNSKFQITDAYFLYLETGGHGEVTLVNENQLKLEYSNSTNGATIQYYQKIEDY